MIFGEYPCCGGDLALSMPDKSPAYMPEDCPHCRAKVWHRLSRVESASWIEADFLAEHDVDVSAKTVIPKPGTEAEAFDRYNRIGWRDDPAWAYLNRSETDAR
ncbi:MAG: hypothetical protein V4522_15875 [Pseudomonadota bacterium]|jgi:hypothetical protein|uniref:hypothetical protein n=1 Tax=unclassified Sphingomonas TaxID=196159 RepID=UPI00053EC9E6|nr:MULTISPECIES: hypothetical protein [unclassified Sphingomonas]